MLEETTMQLVRSAISGDRRALAQLFLLYYDELAAHVDARISRRLQGLIRADDILQQTFCRAAQGIAQFSPLHGSALRNWLKTIADNLLRDAERRRRREKRRARSDSDSQADHLAQLPADRTSPSGHVRRLERAERLRSALTSLHPDQRDIVQRRYLLGQSLEQIARETGRSVGAVRGLCYRARANLHTTLGNTSRYFTK